MKLILITILLSLSFLSKSQVTKIELQASGLTCSMCNKSIHKSLSTIANVNQIIPDLNNNSFAVTFKDSTKINIDELRQKVESAGYKVAGLFIYASLKNQSIANDAHILLDSINYHFIDVKPQTLNGTIKLTLIDKGFVTAKTFKSYNKLTKMSCYQSGFMQSCCSKTEGSNGSRIYHLTI